MPFETNTVASPAALKTAIESFAVTNGWTLASDVLSKGQSNVRLTALDAEMLEIEGANNASFSVGVCPQTARTRIPTAQWPATYRLFSHASPDFIACVLQYSVDRVEQLWFGDIVKYAGGVWTGGNWFGATRGEAIANTGFVGIANPTQAGNDLGGGIANSNPGAPFWGTRNRESAGGTFVKTRAAFLHAEIDGFIWPGANNSGSPDDFIWPDFAIVASPVHSRQPNAWNSESVLLPMWLQFRRADNFYTPLGHLAHMRAIRVDNHTLGQIITIGSDDWMIFPWYRKDTVARNGGAGVGGARDHTGTFGVAIAYDGP